MLNSMYSKKKNWNCLFQTLILLFVYNLVVHPKDSGELKIDMIFNFFSWGKRRGKRAIIINHNDDIILHHLHFYCTIKNPNLQN